jgi:hypothetical protein
MFKEYGTRKKRGQGEKKKKEGRLFKGNQDGDRRDKFNRSPVEYLGESREPRSGLSWQILI